MRAFDKAVRRKPLAVAADAGLWQLNGWPLAPGSINRELATLRRLLRLAHEWKLIQRVPRVRLLRGEKSREFVLSHQQEPAYFAVCSTTLSDVATLLLDTGLRLGEALGLEWPQVKLKPANVW